MGFTSEQEAMLESGESQEPGFEDWSNLTDPAKDLVMKMLCPDATQRLSAEKALKHPWISLRHTVANKSPRRKTIHQLEVLNVKRKWNKAVTANSAVNTFGRGRSVRSQS